MPLPQVPARLPIELTELLRLVEQAPAQVQARVVRDVGARSGANTPSFPVLAVVMGSPAPDAPAVGFFGGVHGLERIGAEVVLAHLRSLLVRMQWDDVLNRLLESVRLVFMPVVNPVGLARGTRANGNGVDLMRNAPVDARERVPFLIGGQRLSASLPWYRGASHADMEPENMAVCEVVEQELLARPFSIAVDCHSGFGTRDRLWFPFAHTARPIEHLPELHALKQLLDETHPQHRYVFEPQSRQYLAHGDLWDHLYLRSLQRPGHSFLPLTLEMGSWLWVRKNPRQLFSRHGIFNPLIRHRQQRVLRQHIGLLDFIGRAACSHLRWVPTGASRDAQQVRAMADWYGGRAD